jgi:hypothetical protein
MGLVIITNYDPPPPFHVYVSNKNYTLAQLHAMQCLANSSSDASDIARNTS